MPKLKCRLRAARCDAGYLKLTAFAKRAKLSVRRLSSIELSLIEPRVREAQRILAVLPGETINSLWPMDGEKKK